MPLIDLRQARSDIRLGWVLQLLHWQVRGGRGVQVRGACPLHGSSSPRSRSFSAHLERGVWQCFRCGASGNALDLWSRANGQGLYQAVLDLYERLGQPVPWLAVVRPANLKREPSDALERPRV